ncbi:hypothetical protein AQUCO_05300045v1 [Aquilegia coerulea]|uniref:Uncharacterized protein n=1 Tax=Aquilegia coerulea TaxID=218851 RepID=A0A2G5CI61_AQUCA|nr:hypothetical protein AQUCO_05300045v1 [Aquilegia coerulea]
MVTWYCQTHDFCYSFLTLLCLISSIGALRNLFAINILFFRARPSLIDKFIESQPWEIGFTWLVHCTLAP